MGARKGTEVTQKAVDDLVKKYKDKLVGSDALPEEKMSEVFLDIGIVIKSMPAVDFTYCFVRDKLKTKGHLLLMAGSGSSMGHTQVVWRVGEPTNESYSVFDPISGQGYKEHKFKELTGNVYVGWAK